MYILFGFLFTFLNNRNMLINWLHQKFREYINSPHEFKMTTKSLKFLNIKTILENTIPINRDY